MNELKMFILKSLTNDPVLVNNLIKVYFEDSIAGMQVSFQFDRDLDSPYIIDIAFKDNDVFSIRVYIDDFFYLKRRALSDNIIKDLPESIRSMTDRLINYFKITGFNLNEDYYG